MPPSVAPQDDANMMQAAKRTDSWQGNGGKGMNERIQTGFWHQPIKLELKVQVQDIGSAFGSGHR
jgi:hypothetical protein